MMTAYPAPPSLSHGVQASRLSAWQTFIFAFLVHVCLATPANAASPPAPAVFWPGSTQGPSGQFDPFQIYNPSATHYENAPKSLSDPDYIFFPPVPPPFEAELPLLAPVGSAVQAPPELAAFASDWFYPLLATRLTSHDLSRSMRMELQTYRTAKLELQNELRARIAALKEGAPGQIEQELAAFAVLQSPRILELENVAEKILIDLHRTGLFGWPASNDDWLETALQTLQTTHGTLATPAELAQESEALRGAAFYREGLSDPQRRLLRETAIELHTQANPNSLSAENNPKEWLLIFSPEPARLRLENSLPAPLAKKISEYVAAKQNLKTELRAALVNSVNGPRGARLATLKALATAQAPRLAALELSAEDIRRALAGLPNPPGAPAPPSLPPELTARISTYRAHKLELLKTLYAMLTSPEKTSVPTKLESASQPDGRVVETAPWIRDNTIQTGVQPVNLRVPPAEFNDRQTRLLAEVNRELAGIREALAEHFRTTNQPADRKSINDLLKDFESARQKQEVREKYRDYQSAVLLPGLSPEQRRLLFDAAVEQLALPLPTGEKVP